MDPNERQWNLSTMCRTCSEIPGKIIEVCCENPDSALVDIIGVRRKVDVALIQDEKPVPGDWVLVHVGFAMSKIAEEDALDRLRTLELLGEKEAAAQEVCGNELAAEDSTPITD